ncbi:Winged helix DNA-binding domain-containing protein [Plantibacter sp. VKM Ac-1784]|uniref:Winged helix DNA-binding domain-containing protein n=1 Tax=Plantibacter elymi (nom. nud.) TaxID=199708 RepID=A0ABY1R9K7_9MICO|nr:MarR family transcriptional regulator [Plantibacter sp. VKM Ac-1784]SMQ62075.1 Winged helix DNA-binding domain-containing protein [Plantibacter sp. VKM Ac-1784]
MQDEAHARAIELLGQFNDRLTRAVDEVFGTRWAEIEEIIALIVIARDSVITTRSLADISGLGRRAISRLIARLKEAGLVTTRSSDRDGRVVEVVLTGHGHEQAEALRTGALALLGDSRELARELGAILQTTGLDAHPSAADPLDLLLDASTAGAKLVTYMPVAATQGRMAARQRAALVYIATHEGVRPGALSEPLEVSHAGAAYLIDQLCDKGFIRRHRNEVADDRRAVILRATPEGLSAVAAVAHGVREERVPLARVFLHIAAWRQPDVVPE